jgi:hypothetical protein
MPCYRVEWQKEELMSCAECINRAMASNSLLLETAKKKARAWGKATGKTELIIVKTDDGYGYRTTDDTLEGTLEVDRIYIL